MVYTYLYIYTYVHTYIFFVSLISFSKNSLFQDSSSKKDTKYRCVVVGILNTQTKITCHIYGSVMQIHIHTIYIVDFVKFLEGVLCINDLKKMKLNKNSVFTFIFTRKSF